MSKNLKKRFLIIFIVVGASLFLTFPISKRINLGLDLKGGMHLVLKVETEKLKDPTPTKRNDAVLRAMEILRNRIDSLGAGETVIQRQGEEQILVQLPGITDRDKALDIVNRVAHLEFKLVNDDPTKLKEALAGSVPVGFELKHIKKEDTPPVLLHEEPILQGDAIGDARVDFGQLGDAMISLTFNSVGAKEFAKITSAHVGDRLAIVLDGEVLSAPNIQEPILSGKAQITGQFQFKEASLLALALRSGALPVPMRVEEERTVGPLLGKDSIEAGVRATIIGGLAVVIFMSGYYLMGGLIASLALLVNLIMIFGFMGFMNVMMPDAKMTLTLPGIAGVILTLGMAVDANVLVNERIREELENGRTLSAALNAGFNRAFSSIFDSHVTNLIAAFMLFQFGSGPIKGFAMTLSIGLIASLFTSLYVARTLFTFLIEHKWISSLPMLHLIGKTNIDFIGKRYFCYIMSLLIVGVGLFSFISKKEAVYGIDFAGGQIQEYKFDKAVSADELRAALKKSNVSDAVIEQFDKNPETVMVRSSEDTFNKIQEAFKTNLSNHKFEVLRVEKVGPIVGKTLRRRAVLAIVFALLGMLIYVGFRFKHFDFAAAAVIALLYDVLVAAGMIVFLGRQIDLLTVTALLTIAGYSINDTIVTYDRVRENMNGKGKRLSLRELINLSVNQTLGRTILTTGVTLLVVVALYLFGGEVLNTFSLTLLIGFASGAFSTIFIASPLVLLFNKKK